MPDDQLGEQF